MKLAVANSRYSTGWKNVDWTWSQLKTRLEKTTRTAETVSEYRSMPKMVQDKIKDVGGFVGGWLNGGKRRANTVLCRSLLTLDLDFAAVDFWDNLTIYNDFAAICYSTHKHTPQAPRLRLLVPLDREVTPDEYEAIARKLAEELGIDQFDDTTYQASRLMYWPSTSQDGEYFFMAQDGEPLTADAYLAKYADWQDVTSWPVSSRQTESIKKHAVKADDPLAKEGIIGAFCRAYSIQDAIEMFLGDIYRQTMKSRYTYIGGSTANGLVVYDQKYAYSNHSTDPAGGRLCNAFDLVRIHKFGELDKDTNPTNLAPSKLPSFQAMCQWAAGQEKVKEELLSDALKPDESDPDTADDGNWTKKLTINAKGLVETTIDNAVLILENDPKLHGLGRYNLFRYAREGHDDLPWSRVSNIWTDGDDANLRLYFEKIYHFKGASALTDATRIVFERHAYHPVREYLESLPPWDGSERLDSLLIRCLKADDTAYTRAVTRKTFVAAVARVMEPGCKFDYMLTIIGAQGAGKSLLAAVMGRGWYSDTTIAITGKDAYDNLEGVWIQEIGELSSFKKAEVEQVKAYISKTSDRYRKAYERNAGEYLRQNIFIGTSNDSLPLRDDTGNRRFWIVESHQKAKTASPDLLKLFKAVNPNADTEIGKLWAEALYYYRRGEPLVLSEELEEVATSMQESHHQEDPRLGLIKDYLAVPLPNNWSALGIRERASYIGGNVFEDGLPKHAGTIERTRVCALEVWCECLGKPKDGMTRYDAKEINQMIEQVEGWSNVGLLRFGPYGVQRGYKNEGK